MFVMARASSIHLLFLFLWASSIGLFVTGSAIENGRTSLETKTVVHCSPPFQAVGERCLLIDNTILGAWDEVRQFCKSLNGDLVNLHDANLLYDIVTYLEEKGITSESFWIGAYDLLDEGHWVWSWNNTDVHMNTPIFGVHSGLQEPSGGTKQNCAMLNKDYYYFVFDDDCSLPHSAICAALETDRQAATIAENLQKITPNNCPEPFIMIGEACLLVDGLHSTSWAEQQQLCQILGGHMAKIDDANDHGALFDYLQENGVLTDLWLGGTDLKSEDNWLWEDGTPVKMSTPFWGANLYGKHEPAGGRLENCLAIVHKDFYFFHDADCDITNGVVCQYDI